LFNKEVLTAVVALLLEDLPDCWMWLVERPGGCNLLLFHQFFISCV